MNADLRRAVQLLAKHIGKAAQRRAGRSKKRATQLARDLKAFVKEEVEIAEKPTAKSAPAPFNKGP